MDEPMAAASPSLSPAPSDSAPSTPAESPLPRKPVRSTWLPFYKSTTGPAFLGSVFTFRQAGTNELTSARFSQAEQTNPVARLQRTLQRALRKLQHGDTDSPALSPPPATPFFFNVQSAVASLKRVAADARRARVWEDVWVRVSADTRRQAKAPPEKLNSPAPDENVKGATGGTNEQMHQAVVIPATSAAATQAAAAKAHGRSSVEKLLRADGQAASHLARDDPDPTTTTTKAAEEEAADVEVQADDAEESENPDPTSHLARGLPSLPGMRLMAPRGAVAAAAQLPTPPKDWDDDFEDSELAASVDGSVVEVIGFPLAVAVLMNQLYPKKFELKADHGTVRAAWRIIDQKAADQRADERQESPLDAVLRGARRKDVQPSAKKDVEVEVEVRGGDAESEKAMRELVGTSDSPEKSAAAIQRLARELAGLDEDFTQYCEGHDKPDFVPVFTVKSMRMLLPQAEGGENVWYRPWFFSKAHLDQVVDMSVRGKAMLEVRRRGQDRYRRAVAAVMAARGGGRGDAEEGNEGNERDEGDEQDETMHEESWDDKAQDDELIEEYMAMNGNERESGPGRDAAAGGNDRTDAAQLLQLGGALLQLVSCDLFTLGDMAVATHGNDRKGTETVAEMNVARGFWSLSQLLLSNAYGRRLLATGDPTSHDVEVGSFSYLCRLPLSIEKVDQTPRSAGPSSAASSDPPIELPGGGVGTDTLEGRGSSALGSGDGGEGDSTSAPAGEPRGSSRAQDVGGGDGAATAGDGGGAPDVSERRRDDDSGRLVGRLRSGAPRWSAAGTQLLETKQAQKEELRTMRAEALCAAYPVRMPTVYWLEGDGDGDELRLGLGATALHMHSGKDNFSDWSVSNMTPSKEERLLAVRKSQPLFIGDLTPLELDVP